MSPLLSRLLLALPAVLAIPLVYSTTLFLCENSRLGRNNWVLLLGVANLATGTVFAATWIGIWHSQVTWSSARRQLTGV